MSICFKRDGKKVLEVPCIRHLNLLGHAQMEELNIGSQCGGHGVCGADRIRISIEDRAAYSPPTEIELQHLGKKAIEEGLRLGCQLYPARDDDDLDIELNGGH